MILIVLCISVIYNILCFVQVLNSRRGVYTLKRFQKAECMNVLNNIDYICINRKKNVGWVTDFLKDYKEKFKDSLST